MKLMARIIAEALVAPMFRGIFKTLTDYSMDKISYRLNGKFVSYDPQEWRDQYDMSINVGIGTGDTMQQSMFLLAGLIDAQARASEAEFGAEAARALAAAPTSTPGASWTVFCPCCLSRTRRCHGRLARR